MSAIFDQTMINGMALSNRLVRSATWEAMCDDDGRPTGRLTDFYRDLAQGGVGLIVTGYTFVSPEGRQLQGKMGIHTDEFEKDYRKLTATVHDAGGKIAVQLVHAGGQTDTKNAGRQPLAPSAVEVDQFPEVPAELTRDEINRIAAAFGDAARRAKEWGFDAVQLHGGHGYLITQFLSPLTNRRTDEYGGTIENRSRFAMEVYNSVRSATGSDFPVMIKLNGADNLEGGLQIDDAVYAAGKLSDAGIDAIEVTGGTPVSGAGGPVRTKIDAPEKEAYNMDLARPIKEAVICPVMVVGGLRSIGVAEAAINDDNVDYIAMSRPFIREPGLANRWQEGDLAAATCISCNGCFVAGLKEGGIYCIVEKKEQEKR
ncbi:MAG: NADH:flavin oxidoreductase [bacterium]